MRKVQGRRPYNQILFEKLSKNDWPQHKLHCGKCDEATAETKKQQARQDTDWPDLAG